MSKAWTTQWFGNPMSTLCRRLKMVKQGLLILSKKNVNVQNNVSLACVQLNDIQERPALQPND